MAHLSNQLLRGNIASSDVINGLHTVSDKDQPICFYSNYPPMFLIFSFIFKLAISLPLPASTPPAHAQTQVFALETKRRPDNSN